MTGGTRFEVLVRTLVDPATVAALRLPLSRIEVRRNTLHRLRITTDGGVQAVLDRLIEHDVQLVEIRRCPVPPHRPDEWEQDQRGADPSGDAEPDDVPRGVVLPFRRPARARTPEHRIRRPTP